MKRAFWQFTTVVLLLTYPFLVWFGLTRFSARQVAVVLVLFALVRFRQGVHSLLGGFDVWSKALLVLPLLFAIGSVWANNEILLRLYPALINFTFLMLFLRTLHRPPSMIERLARLRQPDLPPAAIAYTRRVTQVWCGFFLLNGSMAIYTTFATSRLIWVWYNGMISYGLMGVLFGGEWLLRQRILARK